MEMQLFKKETGELIAWFAEDNFIIHDEYDLVIGDNLAVRGEQDEIFRDLKNNGKREKVYIASKRKKLQPKSLRRMPFGNGR